MRYSSDTGVLLCDCYDAKGCEDGTLAVLDRRALTTPVSVQVQFIELDSFVLISYKYQNIELPRDARCLDLLTSTRVTGVGGAGEYGVVCGHFVGTVRTWYGRYFPQYN